MCKSSWRWTLGCSKHVEDTVIKLNYWCKNCDLFCSYYVWIFYISCKYMTGSKGLHLSDGRVVTPAWWCRIASCVGCYALHGHDRTVFTQRESSRTCTASWHCGAIRLHTTMRQVVPSATCQYHTGPHNTEQVMYFGVANRITQHGVLKAEFPNKSEVPFDSTSGGVAREV
jgi:hypothetical protein